MNLVRQLFTFLTVYLWWSLASKWRWRNCPTCDKWPSLPQAWLLSKPFDPSKVKILTDEERLESNRRIEEILASPQKHKPF